MKVHITLVGGQPAPIFRGITTIKPDRVVFIYSKRTGDVVEKIKKELPASFEYDNLPPLDEVNPRKIFECANLLKGKYKDDDITINISGGLKSWSYIFGISFGAIPTAKVIYIDQNNLMWNYKTFEHTKCEPVDIFTLFRLQGNKLSKFRKLGEYTEKDEKAISEIEKIRRINYQGFNSLASTLEPKKGNLLRNNGSGKFENKSGEYVEWFKTTVDKIGFVRMYLKGKYDKELELISEHVVELFFNSGWFEYKVAKILSSWDMAKGVYLNCVFPMKPNKAKNEVDIIVDTGDKVLFVECRTQITKVTDVDKFKTVKNNYGGMGSKGIFITDERLDDDVREKCKEIGILTFSLKDHNPNVVSKDLFSLLNDNFLDINEK